MARLSDHHNAKVNTAKSYIFLRSARDQTYWNHHHILCCVYNIWSKSHIMRWGTNHKKEMLVQEPKTAAWCLSAPWCLRLVGLLSRITPKNFASFSSPIAWLSTRGLMGLSHFSVLWKKMKWVLALNELCDSLFTWSHNGILFNYLTHWGRVTHICVSKFSILGSVNGLSSGRWN